MHRAAIYCRSSKDRAELGLDIQQKELHDFAAKNGITVVAEFSDMEISGSLDETARPGLRALLNAMRDINRKWDTILAVDTSRIARDPMIGIYVKREAEKVGVEMRFSKMDLDGDTAFGEMMLNVARSFDRLHARLSAEKGRAGAEANIARGYRSGGKAPFGYKLEKHATGATRGGDEVEKSKLVSVPDDAAKVKTFLEARAAGIQRNLAAKEAGLQSVPVATLVGYERNALTYAGFTVWNQRQKVKPTREDTRKTMRWRPREEWVVSGEQTHEAVITRDQAEHILTMHASDPDRHKPIVRNPNVFMLSGLLFTPEGKQWHGDAHDKAYRAGSKGKRVNAPWIEGEVLKQLADDFNDDGFLLQVVQEAKEAAAAIESSPQELDVEIARKQRQVKNLIDVVADTGDKAILGRIRELEAEMNDLRTLKSDWVERASLKQRLMDFTPQAVRNLIKLNGLVLTDQSWMEMVGDEGDQLAPDQLRRILTSLVDRIVLDPETRDFLLRYKLPVPTTGTGVSLASPRGFEPRLPL